MAGHGTHQRLCLLALKIKALPSVLHLAYPVREKIVVMNVLHIFTYAVSHHTLNHAYREVDF